MYTIHADGQLLFDSLSENVESIVLSPKLILDINKAGSLSMVIPPGNKLHGKLKKVKTYVTVKHGDEQIARGRVMEMETDIYNQQRVYCEGAKAFLLDSVQEPYSYNGTVHGLFRKLVEKHNSMVDTEKQFSIGEITAVGGNETTKVECTIYASVSSEIEDRLLNVYGGYLRTRTVNGIHYIDWMEQYGNANAQPIEFSVNLLEMSEKVDAGDVFTCLIPLGASEIGEDGEYTDPVSIASVNSGQNYIQDDDAVALYGKIWKTYTWSYETDPAKLLEKAREYLKTGVALETITLKAIDMHFVDGDVQPIRIGDSVRILSNPHGLDKTMVCSQIEIDLLNPENTLYTFGERPRTLSENVVKAEEEVSMLSGGGGRRSVKEEVGDIVRWANVQWDAEKALVEAVAGELDKTNGNLSAVSLRMDGVEAEVAIAASRVDEVEGRTTSAELAIDGANSKISMHASTLEDHGNSITRAEIAIDGLNDEITMKADRIDLQGYVTAETFETQIAKISKFFSGESYAESMGINGNLYAENVNFPGNVNLLGRVTNLVSLTMGDVASHTIFGAGTEKKLDLSHSHAVTVNDDGTITLGEVSSSGGTFKIADTKVYKDGVSASYTKGRTDWQPDSLVCYDYSTANKTVSVRALNAAGVPVIAGEVEASEIYDAGASGVTIKPCKWVGTTVVVEATNGATNTVRLPTLFLGGGKYWYEDNTTSVYLTMTDDDGSGTYLQDIMVDASSIFAKGVAAGSENGEGYEMGYTEAKEAFEPTSLVKEWSDTAQKAVYVTAKNVKEVGLLNAWIDASEIYDAGDEYGYSMGKTDWNPVDLERTSYNATDMTVSVRALNAAGVPVIAGDIDASEIYTAGNTIGDAEGYTRGKNDWNPVNLVRYDYSADDKTVSVRALNAKGVPLIVGDIDASEIYTKGRGDGAGDVTLSEGGWIGRSNVVTASNGERETVYLPTLTMQEGDWYSDHTVYVHLYMRNAYGDNVSLDSHEVDASGVYSTGYTKGETDWKPDLLERTSYSLTNKTVTVRAVNAAGVPVISGDINASELYDKGKSDWNPTSLTRSSYSTANKTVTVRAVNAAGVPVISGDINASEIYNKGQTDWSPSAIERTEYDTTNKTVTVRALNAVGVPVLGGEVINASEIYDKGKTDWQPNALERTGYSTDAKNVSVRAVNAIGVPVIAGDIDASELYNEGKTVGYTNGKNDWNPTAIERVSYDDSTITVRALNAIGVPVIMGDIDASEIFSAGEETVKGNITIGINTPESITHLGDNVYQMKVKIWAKYNGETIASTYAYPTKGLY